MPKGIALNPEAKRQKQSEAARARWAQRRNDVALLVAFANYTLSQWDGELPAQFARVADVIREALREQN